ncbi:hypothetical protein E4U16_001840 [Claviceps sp. LM84 group G4]|nr:hypothetical protein E4U16_001840 [Claviceps sp. LM84 group G4]
MSRRRPPQALRVEDILSFMTCRVGGDGLRSALWSGSGAESVVAFSVVWPVGIVSNVERAVQA